MNLFNQPLPGAAAEVLAGDADDPTAVDHVIGGEQYAVFIETCRIRDGFQLIVGGAGDDAALQPRDGLRIQYRAEGAGCEYFHVLEQDFAGWHCPGAELPHDPAEVRGIHVCDDKTDTPLGKKPAQVEADVADALYRHPQTLERADAELASRGRFHAERDAERRPGGRVTADGTARLWKPETSFVRVCNLCDVPGGDTDILAVI